MKTILLTLVISVAATDAGCKGPIDKTAVANYVKALDVATLDKALPSQRLDQWLLSGPPHVERVEWQVGNCDIKPEGKEPKGGWPLCVRVQVHRQEVWGWGIVTVGTVRRGIQGQPRLKYITVTSEALGGQLKRAFKLSDLPRILSEVAAADKKARSQK